MALRFDIVIDQGSDYVLVLPVLTGEGTPQPLTDWSARGQVRRFAVDTTVLHDFAPQLSLVGSEVRISVPASVSSGWAWTSTSASYDIELVAPDGAITRLVEGHVIVRPEVTR